jgi:hypothetical protein
MSANTTRTGGQGCRRWSPGIAALAIALGSGAFAQVVAVPPAHLNHTEGSVAYAPLGDQEWHDVQPRRVLKRGDRLWTDRGSRAELQAGGHALRMNGETQLVLENVSETATQLSLTQGTMAATVTRANPGDSFEVGTPNLAFRARQPGDYRIDVDTKHGVTRVAVLSGTAVVYGEKGEALEVRTGQRLTFRDRNLTRMLQPAFAATDDFDRWAGARKRGEPTVSMPVVAAAPEKPIPNTITRGKDIIISGSAASLKQPPPAGKSPATVAPAIAQPATLAQPAAKAMPPPPAALKVAAPMLPPAASVQSAALPAAPAAATAQPQPANRAQANAQAQVQAQAQAQAAAQAAREQQQRLAQERAEEERRALALSAEQERRAAAAARAEQDRRAFAAAEARRAEERRRAAVAARRAEEERRHLAAKREQEQKRQLAMKRSEEERQKKLALARRAAEERRLAAARKAEQQKLAAAEAARRQHLARLQEQARREEQSAQLRRAEAARRADEDRRADIARRAEQARREEDARREEQARREDFERRQRALAEQVRRDQARRDEEVWLRQQQQIYQPVRPQPMGVPARRIS